MAALEGQDEEVIGRLMGDIEASGVRASDALQKLFANLERNIRADLEEMEGEGAALRRKFKEAMAAAIKNATEGLKKEIKDLKAAALEAAKAALALSGRVGALDRLAAV